jgi:microcystin-dependent protein
MSDPYVGEIRMAGFNFAPQGWAFCDGSLLSIAENDVLFALIGTTYGGDGQTTFALPDLRGRIPIHQGNDSQGNSYIIGQLGGVEQVKLTAAQLPAHTHSLSASSGSASATDPTGNVPASASVNLYGTNFAPTLDPSAVNGGGSGQSHDNLMPYQCVSFIISLFGIFPSQN